MKRLHVALIFPCILLSFAVVAQQTSLQAQTQGGVTFLSGGVEADERAGMKAFWPNYNLSLLFSETGSGKYLSGVKVRIENAKGKTILNIASAGPILFIKLNPDRYKVIVNQNGQIIDKVANLMGHEQVSLSFSWAQK
jgi:hypothetical protein